MSVATRDLTAGFEKSHSHLSQTDPCFTPVVLYTKVDGWHDKLVTIHKRLFTALATRHGKIFLSPEFGRKFQ